MEWPRNAASTAPTQSAPPSSSSGWPSASASRVSGFTIVKTTVAMQATSDAPRRSIQRAIARPSIPAAATQGIDPSW